LTFQEAAALPVVALTTVEAYDRAAVKPNERVLVIGASGGCGMFGVLIGKVLGAKVTGICSTKNVPFVVELGADEVVDYRNSSSMEVLLAQKGQFDVIYDTVSSFDPADPNYEVRTIPGSFGTAHSLLGSPPLDLCFGREAVTSPSMDSQWTGCALPWCCPCFCSPFAAVRNCCAYSLGLSIAKAHAAAAWQDMWVTRPLLGMKAQRAGYELFLLVPTRDRITRLTEWFDSGNSLFHLDYLFRCTAI
jgi:hypothetical protein